MANDDWKRRRVFLRDPDGGWEVMARDLVAEARGKEPKVKGRAGRRFIVAPDIATALIARQFAVRSAAT